MTKVGKWVSKCCHAEMKVVGGDEGTNHYECLVCGEPCDFVANEPVGKKTTAKWEKVMREAIESNFPIGDSLVCEIPLGDYQLGVSDLLATVEKLLQDQREELQEEQNRVSNSGRKLFQEGYKQGWNDRWEHEKQQLANLLDSKLNKK